MGKIITTTITNKVDLKNIAKADAKNAVIDCQMGSGMPISLHNAIAEHNAQIKTEKKI